MRSRAVDAAEVARVVAASTGLGLPEATRWCTVVEATVDELVASGFTLVDHDVEVGDPASPVLRRYRERADLLTGDDLDALSALDPVGTAEALGLDVSVVARHPLGTIATVAVLAMAAAGASPHTSPHLAEQVLVAVGAWFAGLAGDAPRAAASGDGETAVA
ncbi:hypothetical protein [Solicola sp. PLA-1-18]|uniref:hypothetical protein n=1 Tax=Solicola sp. PLA-1-18 TaxID=3380532 RepID=UPI003B7F376C